MASSSFFFFHCELWRPPRWFRNSFSVSLPWSQVTKVSSTYLNQHTGLCVVSFVLVLVHSFH
jgi:hypothetical protein